MSIYFEYYHPSPRRISYPFNLRFILEFPNRTDHLVGGVSTHKIGRIYLTK